MDDILQQIIYFFGHGLCHQLPERSFEAGGLHFAVCARDTGIYLGLFLSIVVAQVIYWGARSKPREFMPAWAIVACAALFVPYAFDGITSYAGLRETTNAVRYFTGLAAGIGAGTLLAPALMQLVEQIRAHRRQGGAPVETLHTNVGASSARSRRFVRLPYSGGRAMLAPTGERESSLGAASYRSTNASSLRGRPQVAPTVGNKVFAHPVVFVVQILVSLMWGALFYLIFPFIGAVGPVVIASVVWLTMTVIAAVVLAYASLFKVLATKPRIIAWIIGSLVLALVVLALLGVLRDGIAALTGIDPTLQNLLSLLQL